jgi:hypothetical protein
MAHAKAAKIAKIAKRIAFPYPVTPLGAFGALGVKSIERPSI